MQREDLTPENLEALQIQLEEEAVLKGREKYYEHLAAQEKHCNLDRSKPCLQLIRRTVSQLGDAIEDDRNRKSKTGRYRLAVARCQEIDSYDLAYLTLRYSLAQVNRETTWSSAANRVGTAILEEHRMRAFEEQEPKRYIHTQMRLRESDRKKADRELKQAKAHAKDAGAVLPDWPADERIHVGTWLLDLLCQATGLFVSQLVTQSRNRTVRMFLPTPELLDWISDSHEMLSMLCPIRMPMVVRPRPWTNPRDGGYLTDLGGEITVVKTKNRGYIEGLEQIDMPEVYDALNALQDVRWQVNRPVLEVAQALWSANETVGSRGKESLPARDALPVPAVPGEWDGRVGEWRRKHPEEYKIWARRAAEVHQRNDRLASKRVSCAEAMAVAERFAEFPVIYFPWQMDFRGRAYPISAHLNPQGSDLSKALLRFADGKRLGKRGAFWLKVHLANCFGVDKVSYSERVDWVEQHAELLADSGLGPLEGQQFWREADSPFQALAACIEFAGYLIEGEDYVSHIPVGMDGSCNGLQNFSAMLRDPVGGKATNLLPADQPADIYTEVLQVVKERVRREAEAGKQEAIIWDGHLVRSMIKQPVMTLPYGSTWQGMRKQIEAAVIKAGNPLGIETNQMWTVCGYLAEVVYESIGQVVIAARAAMDWLQEVAKLIASDDLPIRWTTPVGLPVLQEYRQYKGKRIKCHIGGRVVKLSVAEDGPQLDRRRQRLGISPNYVHSLDAAHMMKTVLLGKTNGLEHFGMVHDSYAVHAADVDVLHAAIRDAFIEMYEPNRLAQFRDEVASQVSNEVAAQFPELPSTGDLDLAQVRDADYFFA